MKNKMTTAEVRNLFVSYFKKHGHEPVASSSLVPYGDDTILFTNAGMNQFKNTFLGVEKRPYSRAVSVQKCVRAGGKHNDLDNVGFTSRHHTFFQMLGNFSFGDYFKKDAIHLAWQLLTKEMGIPKERLHVSVFETDDEAADIWHKQEGVPRDKIKRYGEKDNFWRMGDTGPCGPCSEIFYDHGDHIKSEDERYVEIWNNVFMQYNEGPVGTMTPLPKPSVDTGAGLERMAAVMQGTHVNYETDEIRVLIDRAQKITGVEYGKSAEVTAAYRVLADHARAAAFLIGDGVLPSNEGRGYVLRRIMRRGIRYGRKLSETKSILPDLAVGVIEGMGDFYPELRQNRALITKTVLGEEERFVQTLDQGTEILNAKLSELSKKGSKALDGETAFKLYDTYGFPVDLTNLMAREKGFTVDESAFEARMSEARKLSQSSWKGKAISSDQAHLIEIGQKVKATEFVGYAKTEANAKVTLISDGKHEVTELKAGQAGLVAFDLTPFYAESGGQAGDSGVATGHDVELLIGDCTKSGSTHLHHVTVSKGLLKIGQELELRVDKSQRRKTMSNHSATHLLHAALRKVLGAHVTQAGSLVDETKTRFDFTHNAPLTSIEISEIEALVNAEISAAHQVDISEKSYADAIKAGAMALFGEKYGDRVRVLKMGEFSVELCGGTHVPNTSMIRLFKIVSEGGISSGVRRIEALTGDAAFEYLNRLAKEDLSLREKYLGSKSNWQDILSNEPDAEFGKVHAESGVYDFSKLNKKISILEADNKRLLKELKQAKSASIDLDAIIKNGKEIKGGKYVTAIIDNDDRDVLMQVAEGLKSKVRSGVVVVVGKGTETHPLIVLVTSDLTKDYQAGKLLGTLASALGGKGGGKPDSAQGAGRDISGLDKALSSLI